MNQPLVFTLKVFRKLYKKAFLGDTFFKAEPNVDPDLAGHQIFTLLAADKPCMIARFGSTEMNCLCNYYGIKNEYGHYLNYIIGKTNPWWWEPKVLNQLEVWSGFFPANTEKAEEFCIMMNEIIPEVNLLGSWLKQEDYFEEQLKQTEKISLELLNPYFAKIPWTKALAGKKVLVVHPFAKTIARQYQKRNLIFQNNLLPEFDLKTIKAVQSIAGEKTEFADWFAALDFMKAEIDKVDYDICLIGCGAYGFPLAAHVKRMGKKGFHLGGSLQLLFGIRGSRWENENYHAKFNYSKLMNEHWVKPDESETPENALKVENGTYW